MTIYIYVNEYLLRNEICRLRWSFTVSRKIFAIEFLLDTNMIKNLFKYFSQVFKHIQIHQHTYEANPTKFIQCVWYNTGAKVTFDGMLRLLEKEWQ